MSLDTTLFVAIFAVLLGLEWRYRRRDLRVGAVLLALAVLAFYHPNYTTARRRALSMPRAERITSIGDGRPVSDYESGVYTTIQAVGDAAAFGEGARLAAVGALVWLACSPTLWQARGPSNAPASRSMAGDEAPEA